MADPVLLTVLAYAHVLSAIGWLGGVLLTTFVVGPGLQTVSAPSRLEFMAKVMPKILRYIMMMIASTLVFGLLFLYFFIGGDFSRLAPSTPFGIAISAGMVVAVITALLGVGMVIPSFRKVIAIADQMLKSGQTPPPPELMKYSKRARLGSIAATSLLLLVLVMMVTAAFY